jgi:hypothetical protein
LVGHQVTDTALVNWFGDDPKPKHVQPNHHDHGSGVGGELSFHKAGNGAAASVEAEKAVSGPCLPRVTGL